MTHTDLQSLPDHIRELTLRSIEALPVVDADSLRDGEQILVVHLTSLLDNLHFDALCIARIYVGDFGLYRVGDVVHTFTPAKHIGRAH